MLHEDGRYPKQRSNELMQTVIHPWLNGFVWTYYKRTFS